MTLLDSSLHSIQVRCKDCGKDAGWTGEHHCSYQQRPRLPTLCSSTSSQNNDSSDEEQLPELAYVTKKLPQLPKEVAEKPLEKCGRWSFFRSSFSKPVKQNMDDDEPSIYYDTYASHIQTADINPRRASRVRENEKWKELTSGKKEEKNGKLWDKLFQSSESLARVDNYEADSDSEDWEGETHISRILREYYQDKYRSLPSWLLSDKTPISVLAGEDPIRNSPPPRQRKLWQTDNEITPREKERLALRRGTFEEQSSPKSKNQTQLRATSESYQHNPNMIRRTRTSQSTIP